MELIICCSTIAIMTPLRYPEIKDNDSLLLCGNIRLFCTTLNENL